MRVSKLWMAAVPLALAACGGGDAGDAAPVDSAAAVVPAPAPVPAESVAGQVIGDTASMPPVAATHTMATMNPVGNSTLGGDVMVMAGTPSGSSVTVRVNKAPAGSTVAAHVHTGRCGTGGPVAAPIGPITVQQNGEGTLTVAVPMAPAALLDGNHFVQFHEPNGSPGAPAACADLPVQATA